MIRTSLHRSWRACASLLGLALVCASTLATPGLHAQQTTAKPGVPFDPEVEIQYIGFDQKLGSQLPLDVSVLLEDEREVELSTLFGERPVVLAFVYFGCPGLCTEVLNGAVASMRALSLEPGRDYDFIVLSIDPTDTAQVAGEKKQRYLDDFAHPEASGGWHFLRARQPQIDRLTTAAGFRYVFYPETGEYAHASGLMVLTPKGELSRYLFGVEYSNKDLRLSLVEASEGKVGNLVDQFLMLCFHYDPVAGKYGFAIINFLRLFGLLFVLMIAIFILRSLRHERRVPRPLTQPS